MLVNVLDSGDGHKDDGNMDEGVNVEIVSDSGDDLDSDEEEDEKNAEEDETNASDNEDTFTPEEENVPYNGDSFSLKQMFTDVNAFRIAVEEYSVKNHRAVKFTTSSRDKLCVECVDPKCPYRIWCSREDKFYKIQIKSIEDKHTCALTSKPPLCDSRWLARKFIEKFRRNNNFRAADLRSKCLNTYGVSVSLAQCFRAKQKALKKIQGSQTKHFAKLRAYENELLRSNRGSTVLIQTNNENPNKPIFQRMYICFDALRQGCIGNCRPIIGLDGAFLKGSIKGEILSAVGRDANNQMYPIAWAVVEVENTNYCNA